MIDVSAIRERLSYNPETGELHWLPRIEFGGERKGEVQRWNARYSGKLIRTITSHGYAAVTINDRQIPAHRVAFALYHGRYPTGQIDHINGDKTDNRITNLREVDARQNARNRKRSSRNKSGSCGVCSTKYGTYIAYISTDDARIHLGTFKTLEDAVAARAKSEMLAGYHPNHGRQA